MDRTRRREDTSTQLSSAYAGPLTPKEVVEEFPPPPDLPDPEGAIASFDKNHDGTVCVLPLPNGPINVIDNLSNAP